MARVLLLLLILSEKLVALEGLGELAFLRVAREDSHVLTQIPPLHSSGHLVIITTTVVYRYACLVHLIIVLVILSDMLTMVCRVILKINLLSLVTVTLIILNVATFTSTLSLYTIGRCGRLCPNHITRNQKGSFRIVSFMTTV